ncbi:MAG: Sua5/YciO/YrdC/YwlC family protein [Planctomycetota bacterium]|nr:Sua5/YciO/YrdC/YwlC family protein [Planctomycetota bacterium]
MSAIRIDVRSAHDLRDVIHRGVQALAEGKLVVLPTETVYGLAALLHDTSAVKSLLDFKNGTLGRPLALSVKSSDEAWDYIPQPAVLGRRLARRCWPGPVTLVFDVDHPESLVKRLPQVAQNALICDGTMAVRVPAHGMFQEILRLLPGPVLLASANRVGVAEPTSGEEALVSLGQYVSLILDEGRSQFGQPSTVVRVNRESLVVERVGVVSTPTVRRLASFVVLLVCTGNTCRSPMAEMLCKQLLAERMGCPIHELEDRGVLVVSAGIAAAPGMGPSPEAVQVMSEINLDLSHHASQPISDHLARSADVILTMTRGHHQALVSHWPELADRANVLGLQGEDVADPIGASPEMYRRCAEQISTLLRSRVAEWAPGLLDIRVHEIGPESCPPDIG